MGQLRLAVFASAGGTTLQNLLDVIAAGQLDARIVLVASNNADSYALERARKANISTAIVSRKQAGSLEEFSKRLFDQGRAAKADLVCLAGFLHLLRVPDDFLGRVMNIHPSLIPAF